MFGRRQRRTALAKLGHLLWPRIGWRRASAYISHRVRRLPGSPYSIAAGFACGAAVSFTPLIGFHFILAALLSWVLGGNLISSAIGTVVGNPWTFPLIWLASYRFGAWALGLNGIETLPDGLTMGYIFDHPGAVLLPMMIGGVPMAVLAWAVSFWLVRRAVARYQQLRMKRLKRRAERNLNRRVRARPVAAVARTPVERG